MRLKRSRFNLVELVVLALVMVVIAGVIVPMLLPRGHEKPPTNRCAGNLKQIGLAMLMYSGEYDGFFANSVALGKSNLSILNDEGYLQDGKVYGCPGRERLMAQTARYSNYAYIGSGLKDDNNDPTENSLGYDLSGNHPDNHWMNVLFIDGHVSGAKPGTQSDKFSNNWPMVKKD